MPGPNIIKPRWGKACKSCGPGGDDPDNRLLLVALLLLGAGASVFVITAWLEHRGLRILGASCAWDPSANAYVAQLSVENTETVYKRTDFQVQARLTPPPGRRWPSALLQDRLEATSQQVMISLGPEATATKEVRFLIADVEGFACRARVWAGRSERFTHPPPSASKTPL